MCQQAPGHGTMLTNGETSRGSSHRQPSLASWDKMNRTTARHDSWEKKVSLRCSVQSPIQSSTVHLYQRILISADLGTELSVVSPNLGFEASFMKETKKQAADEALP